MRKLPFILLFVSLLVSCNDDSVTTVLEQQKSNFDSRSAIDSYIKATRGSGVTRSAEPEYDIVPYVIEEDTVMYLVNYNPGWQLFSNCCCAPLVLASSESGSMTLEDIMDQESPKSEYIRMMAEDIHTLNMNVDPSVIIESESEAIPLPSTNPTLFIDTIRISQRNHLLITKWGANEPWNTYIREINGHHGKVGCAAIGVGQYLYYQHFKTGVPATTMSKAERNLDGTYSFSVPSSTIWGKMAKTRNDNIGNSDSTAVFLSYLAEEMNGDFQENATATYPSDCISFLASEGFLFNYVTIDYNYIINSIIQNEPVIVTLKSIQSNGSHLCIVDGYRKEDIQVYNYLRDQNGILQREVVRSFVNKYIKFNWGYDGYNDDTWFVASDADDWQTYYYNPNIDYTNPILYEAGQTRKMFKVRN